MSSFDQANLVTLATSLDDPNFTKVTSHIVVSKVIAILQSMSSLDQANLVTLATSLDARPERTKICYKTPIKEYNEFCEERQFLDSNTVTEAKLNFFIRECVLYRPTKKGRNKGKSVGIKTIQNYISAVISLFNEQTQTPPTRTGNTIIVRDSLPSGTHTKKGEIC